MAAEEGRGFPVPFRVLAESVVESVEEVGIMPLVPANEVLAALPPPQRQALTEKAVARRLSAGEVLWLSGASVGPAIVTRGLVKLSARDVEGDEVIVRLVWPGELIGDLGPGRPHAGVDAIAAAPSTVLLLDGDILQRGLRSSPAALFAHAASLSCQLGSAYRVLLGRSTGDATTRLAGVLLDLVSVVGDPGDRTARFELPVGQTELGRMAGACRETTCKVLSRLRRRGVLDYEGRAVRILDPEILRAISCGERA